MKTVVEDLNIELEDVATRSRLAGVLGLFAGVTQQWHFVGMVDGRVRYDSPAFAAPYSWGHLPLGETMTPQEAWAAGMTEALADLRRELGHDGWVETGRGERPWQYTYRRGEAARS